MTMKNLSICLFILLIPAFLASQDDKSLLSQLVAEERETVDALVLYPEETRIAILEACLYPEVLVKTTRIQERTRAAFQDLIDTEPREVQEQIWDLTRYPDLISELASGSHSQQNLEDLAGTYPEEIRESIIGVGSRHMQLLRQIHALDEEAAGTFEAVVMNYPAKTQEAYRHLVSLPEVLSLLTEDIELAILAGDVYRDDPAWVLHKADSLNLVVAQENAKELEEWKRSLEENPEAMEDLKASAEEFSGDYSYDDESYTSDDIYYEGDVVIERSPARRVVVEHYDHHYPYWFGYPYWYESPRWRPFPYWWDCGFYYTPGRTVVITHMPSYYFMHWYLFRPRHHYYYPHLSSHFVEHAIYHPRPTSSITVSVDQWRRENSAVLTERWLEADGRKDLRAERLKEFGQFEMDRQEFNRTQPDRQLTQREYLARRPDQYKELPADRVRDDIRTEPERRAEPVSPPDFRARPDRTPDDVRKEPMPPRSQPVPAPDVPRKEPERQPPSQPVPPRQQPVKRDPPRQEPVKRDIPDMERAKSHHQNTWEKTKRPEAKEMPSRIPPQKAPEKQNEPRRKD